MSRMIDANTVLLGLLASPCRHSISPAMHNAAFDKLGINYAYLSFDVDTDTIKGAVDAIRVLKMRGANVSMPNKRAVVQYMDKLSPAAEIIQAVNTIVNDDGILTGHNTDGIGFVQSLIDEGIEVKGKKLVLAGAGGAGTAIATQAALDGFSEIAFFNRKNVRLETADVYCDATSVGMVPLEEMSLIEDPAWFHEDMAVCDIVYAPRTTKLMKVAKKANVRHVINGLGMVLNQGAAAFELWCNQKMPIEYVKKQVFDEV